MPAPWKVFVSEELMLIPEDTELPPDYVQKWYYLSNWDRYYLMTLFKVKVIPLAMPCPAVVFLRKHGKVLFHNILEGTPLLSIC